MCAVAGFIDFSGHLPQGEAVLSEMLEVLSHRGPDGQGIWSDGDGVFLGHRRLAIVELSEAGHQPMASSCGRYVLTFNGEIYNHEDLRAELQKEKQDFSFRGHSDTEVLVESFSTWGIKHSLSKIAGMFAIAVWDREKRVLSLMRDRLGEKPLYVAKTNQQVFFSSELKGLKKCPHIDFSLDRAALQAMLRYGYIPAPMSIYKGVQKVLPGQVVEIHGGQLTSWSYWNVEQKFLEKKQSLYGGSFEEATEELDKLVVSSVQKSMQADVSLGAFLSGGVDSSLVAGVMQKLSTKKIKTYSIGFHNTLYDEAPFAREVAQFIGSEHTELYVSEKDLLDTVPFLPQVYDEPFSDSSQMPTILLSKMARAEVTVALSGDGADELFAGYQRYLTLNSTLPQIMKVPAFMRSPLGGVLQRLSSDNLKTVASMAKVLIPNTSRLDEKISKAAPLMAAKDFRQAYEMALSTWNQNILKDDILVDDLASKGFECPDISLLDRMLLSDLQCYLSDGVLVKVDRAAMSASLETRAPFLDKDIVEYSFSLPDSYKIRNSRGKAILRSVLDGYVPSHLIDRPKMGFSVPLAEWLRGPLKAWGADLLSVEGLRRQGIFNADLVDSKWREHLSGRKDWSRHLWAVMMFQQWLRHESQ